MNTEMVRLSPIVLFVCFIWFVIGGIALFALIASIFTPVQIWIDGKKHTFQLSPPASTTEDRK